MSKEKVSYYFIDKERLMKRSRTITAKIEKMVDLWSEFKDVLLGLNSEAYISFQALFERAGFTLKQLEKMEKMVNRYRDQYFQVLAEIEQKSMDEYLGGSKP